MDTITTTPNGKNVKPTIDNCTMPIETPAKDQVCKIDPKELENPLQMIGKLINTSTRSMVFFADYPAKKQRVVIPSAGSYGVKERALRALRSYLVAVTENLERDQAVTDKDTLKKLELFAAKGWKFTTYTKIGLVTVASEKLKEVIAKVNFVKAAVYACPDLAKSIETTKLLNNARKEIKVNGLAAGFKMALDGGFKGLPAIVK